MAQAGCKDLEIPARPTVAEYLERIEERFGERTRRTYAPYWKLLISREGGRHLNELSTDDLADVVAAAGGRARANRPGSRGLASEETAVAAIRALYRRAEASSLVLVNPAAKLAKPRRLPNRRRSLTGSELAEVWEVTAALSGDPELDLLIIRFHAESGARQAGALALRRGDLDLDRHTIWLREKFGKEREQPVSATLLHAIVEHAAVRGAYEPDDQVFRYRPRGISSVGAPLTRRRYDRLFAMLRDELAWAQRLGLSAHVLRHTAGTAVERVSGFAVARAFLGHEGGVGPTSIYTKASIHEVAAAVAIHTGEPHPLAGKDSHRPPSVGTLKLPARSPP